MPTVTVKYKGKSYKDVKSYLALMEELPAYQVSKAMAGDEKAAAILFTSCIDLLDDGPFKDLAMSLPSKEVGALLEAWGKGEPGK